MHIFPFNLIIYRRMRSDSPPSLVYGVKMPSYSTYSNCGTYWSDLSNHNVPLVLCSTYSREACCLKQSVDEKLKIRQPWRWTLDSLHPAFVRLFRRSYLSSCIFLNFHHVCPEEGQHSLAETLALTIIYFIVATGWISVNMNA